MPSPPPLSLAHCAAILRGVLAESSGDPDSPWRRVILRSQDAAVTQSQGEHTPFEKWESEILAASQQPPLALAVPLSDSSRDDASAQTRDAMVRALTEYRSASAKIPKDYLLPEVGQFHIEEPATDIAFIGRGPLHHRVALVTGAAGAIGHGICRKLMESGAHVVAADLSQDGLDTLARQFSDLAASQPDDIHASRLMTITMDVTDHHSVAAGFEQVVKTWGGIDIVIVNAGIAHVAALTDLPLETFQKLEKVNVEGTLLTITEAARWMKLQNTGGDIVLISTKNVPSPSANFGAYSATKAAAHQLARIASLELAPFDIRVNMVAPDGVFSDDDGQNQKVKSGLWATVGPDRMKARGLDEAGLEEYYRNRNLLKARVTARHVANAVMFFVTRQTPTTGATIPVDGGLPDATPR